MLNQFMYGAVMMASLVSGIFFLKFWKKTGDRFFAMFSAAFFLFALERWFFVFVKAQSEASSFIFIFRLIAFSIIILAVVDKNRR